MVQCTVSAGGGWAVWLGAHLGEGLVQGCQQCPVPRDLGPSVESALAPDTVMGRKDGGAGAGAPGTWTRCREGVWNDMRGAMARLKGAESWFDSPFHLPCALSKPLSACWEIPGWGEETPTLKGM